MARDIVLVMVHALQACITSSPSNFMHPYQDLFGLALVGTPLLVASTLGCRALNPRNTRWNNRAACKYISDSTVENEHPNLMAD